MSKIFCGIDYSMTSPGICVLNEDGSIKHLKFYASKSKHEGIHSEVLEGWIYPIYDNDITRFKRIATNVINMLIDEVANGCEVLIGIEGYSFGSTGSRLFQIAENCGILKYMLQENGFSFETVPPSVVKKLATGKGNSPKDPVYKAFVDKTGIKLHDILNFKTEKAVSPLSDLADAFWIAEWLRKKHVEMD